MRTNSKTLLTEALALPRQERTLLARELVASLDADAEDADAEATWAAEVEDRARAVLNGEADGEDGDEALAEVRAEIESHRRGEIPTTPERSG